MLEEMLAAGAPVSAHWVADRQSGPMLLRFGTEAQREKILPAHRARRAGLRHRHERAGLGLRSRVDPHARGPKVGRRLRRQRHQGVDEQRAPVATTRIALFRTQVVPDKKHEGLTQFLVDLRPPGHHDPAHHRPRRPAPLQRGQLHRRLRPGGHARRQRGRRLEAGDDRAGLRAQRARALPVEHRADQRAGARRRRATRRPRRRGRRPHGGQLATLRQMSLSVAAMLQAGQNPNLEAAAVKDVGTTFEQSIPELVHALLDLEPTLDSGSRPPAGARLPHAARAVVLPARRHPRGPARHHRARAWAPMKATGDWSDAVDRSHACLDQATHDPSRPRGPRYNHDRAPDAARRHGHPALHRSRHQGADRVGREGRRGPTSSGARSKRAASRCRWSPRSAGGAGGTWLDAHVVVRAAGRHTAPVPLAETIVAGAPALAGRPRGAVRAADAGAGPRGTSV